VNAEDVPVELRLNVEKYAREAAGKLGLPAPTIAWHEAAPDDASWYAWASCQADIGQTNIRYLENVIHIKVPDCAALALEDVRTVVYHECRHLWQIITGTFTGPDIREKDADEWVITETGYVSRILHKTWNFNI
jgi:hypothetical protein